MARPNTLYASIHALRVLNRPTAQWDDLLIYVLSSKLDAFTLREWQTSLSGSDIPTFKQLADFIAHRCQVLEATGKASVVPARNINPRANGKRQTACAATLKFKCSYCKGDHSIYQCKDFLDLIVARRNAEFRKLKICLNCLPSTLHTATKCTSGACRVQCAKPGTTHCCMRPLLARLLFRTLFRNRLKNQAQRCDQPRWSRTYRVSSTGSMPYFRRPSCTPMITRAH